MFCLIEDFSVELKDPSDMKVKLVQWRLMNLDIEFLSFKTFLYTTLRKLR